MSKPLAEQIIEETVDKLNSTPAVYKVSEDDKGYKIEKVELRWVTSLASGQRVPELDIKFKEKETPTKFTTYNTIFNILKFVYFKEVEGEENGNQA